MDISMKGYLTKEKKLSGMKRLSVRYGSRRRWFQLEGQELRYYETEEYANERKHESLRGFINIFDIQSVRKTSVSRPNTFQIVTRRKGSLCLTADSEDVTNKWIECLQLAMRLKRSTISISEVLKGSVSDDVYTNSSDEEFWEKESEEQHRFSNSKDVGDDDVFSSDERRSSETKLQKQKFHIYEKIDLTKTSPPGGHAENKSDVTDSRCTLRESGYETTEFSDAADYDLIFEGNRDHVKEVNDEKQDQEMTNGNLGKVGNKGAVDVLKDLLRRTVVSETQGYSFNEEQTLNEDSDDKSTEEQEEVSAIDQLRSLLQSN